MTENLTYADLGIDTEIVSLQTGEKAVIRSLTGDDGMLSVKIVSGPDAGDYVSMSPAEVLTYWRKVN
jgi:hypothetical protein